MLMERINELRYTVESQNARLFQIENKNLNELKAVIKKHKDDMVIDELLRELIPGFGISSRHHRKALIDAFSFVNFCAGVKLYTEGKPNPTAYLLLEGEIRLSKKSRGKNEIPDYSRNMVNLSKVESASFRIPQKKDFQKPQSSIDRHAARNYQLGVRSGKAWVGEEVIFMDENQPFRYTATTTKDTRAIVISKDNMFKIMGQYYPDYL